MPVFTYRAMGGGAGELSGTVVADTPRAARDSLRSQGLTVHEVTEHRAAAKRRAGGLPWVGRVSPSQLISAYRELSTLLAVGIPLLDALNTVSRQYDGRLKSVLLMLRERVSAGVSLAEAMAEHERVFDPLVRSIVEVGEKSGSLDESLQRVAELKEKSSQLKGRIGTALLYPAFVLCMGAGVSVFLMTFVVPGLLTVITDSGRPLPLSTRLVKAASDLLLTKWWLIVLLLAAVIIAAVNLGRVPAVIRSWHGLQLRIPLLGDLIRKQAIARIAMVMATLLRSGLTFVQTLKLTQNLVSNSVLRQALIDCQTAVYAGRDIATALEGPAGSSVIPPTVVQVFAVGQESGHLEQMLERLSKDYDQHVTTAAARLTAVLEPIVILLLAVVVGFIAFATVMPILEVSDVL